MAARLKLADFAMKDWIQLAPLVVEDFVEFLQELPPGRTLGEGHFSEPVEDVALPPPSAPAPAVPSIPVFAPSVLLPVRSSTSSSAAVSPATAPPVSRTPSGDSSAPVGSAASVPARTGPIRPVRAARAKGKAAGPATASRSSSSAKKATLEVPSPAQLVVPEAEVPLPADWRACQRCHDRKVKCAPLYPDATAGDACRSCVMDVSVCKKRPRKSCSLWLFSSC